ncbi:MAG: sugar phosphate isomerase/epimerase, partial [Gemmatimonadetes bacterium]|nr:sugar phosphate isomerase/epimerase [Gemmatimonadota bacterium]
HVEGTDAVVTVENFTHEGVSVEDRVRFLDALDHPQVGMILDIGHVRDENGVNPMSLSGGPTRVLKLCGHRLRHIHLHGFREGRDHFPPLAAGDEIQWRELLRMLRSVDYPGYMNFEPQGDPVHSGTLEQTACAPERLAEISM